MEALQINKISDRQVCVKWWKLGRYLYGFRMDNESHSHCASLEDLATTKEDKVLDVLDQGLIHEVLLFFKNLLLSIKNYYFMLKHLLNCRINYVFLKFT